MNEQVVEAGVRAEQIADEVRASGTVEAAAVALEALLGQFEAAGGNLDEVVPGEDVDGLGFVRLPEAGRRLLGRYGTVLHESVCKADGDLHKLLSQGLAATGASVVTVIVGALGMSMLAAPIVAPIAGVMLALGVKAYCAEFPVEGEPAASDPGAGS